MSELAGGGRGDAEQGRLGELESEPRRFQAAAAQGACDEPRQQTAPDVPRRDVDADVGGVLVAVLQPTASLQARCSDVAVDLQHQVAGLGDREEGVGGEHTADRVVPADQRFVRGHGAVAEPEDRLVVEEQRPRCASPRASRAPCPAGGWPARCSSGTKRACRSRPLSLARYRAASALRSRSAAGDARLGERDADADRHRHVVGRLHRPVISSMSRWATCSACARDVERLAEHHELVAAEPGRRVAVADAGQQPFGRLDEHGVAGLVPAAVVDQLEVVEVAEQQGHRTTGDGGAGQGLGGAGQQRAAVRQAGQLVVRGLVRERRCAARSVVTSSIIEMK